MKRLVIIGAGGFARETLDVVEAINAVETQWEFMGFLDDTKVDDPLITQRGARILGRTELIGELDCEYVIAIADPAVRKRIDESASAAGRAAATLIHPGANFASVNTVGAGCVAGTGAVVTTNVSIGRHVHLNLAVTVGHDTVLGNYVTLNPGVHVSGNVTLEDGVSMGTGASIIQGLSVGAASFIGAGAVVTKTIPAGVTAVGIPARPLVR